MPFWRRFLARRLVLAAFDPPSASDPFFTILFLPIGDLYKENLWITSYQLFSCRNPSSLACFRVAFGSWSSFSGPLMAVRGCASIRGMLLCLAAVLYSTPPRDE